MGLNGRNSLSLGFNVDRLLEKTSSKQYLAQAAVELAESIEAAGIVVITRRGVMANHVTNSRPFKTPIFAFTNDSRTRRSLNMNRAVTSYRIDFSADPEKTLRKAFELLMNKEHLRDTDKVVVISDAIATAGVDAIQVRHIGENK